ncbi:uncharacterized protein LOC124419340 [Lucilia cuprina]|uniref:uncharacterized protein LOC124419340 n=1 Tax=Lucilia cuprina TaxID=7375 RepID=UPI001F0515E6|nr:uncharacterized protein LOC124419340 [Lucilia cuprina]
MPKITKNLPNEHIHSPSFLVDKFGKYKPVVVMSLLLNAIFHHSLLFIPQQEIPGVVPSAFVMRHPDSGDIEVWWSPCPSRECPEEPELELAVNQCVDYCLLQESATTTTTASTLFSPSTGYYAVTDKIAIHKTQPTTTSKPFLATSAVALPSSSPASAAEFPTSTTISQPLGIADGAATQTPTATTTRSIFQDVLNMSATMFPPVVTSLSSMSMLEQQDWNPVK